MDSRFDKYHVDSIPELHITSLGEYVNAVEDLAIFWRKNVKNYTKAQDREHFPGELVPWFRGNTKYSYELEPALLRDTNNVGISNFIDNDNDKEMEVIEAIRGIEEYMIRRFSTSGLPHVELHQPMKIHWHMLMQHNGLPTRLLDWSKSALIALYFAIRKCSERSKSSELACDSAVWAIDPRRLQEECEGTRRIYTEIDADKQEIIENYINLNRACHGKLPLPIIPAHVHDRISAQQARFTFHLSRKRELIEFGERLAKTTKFPPLVKFIIPFESQVGILRALRLMGVSDQEITPSLDSISTEIKQRIALGRADLLEI